MHIKIWEEALGAVVPSSSFREDECVVSGKQPPKVWWESGAGRGVDIWESVQAHFWNLPFCRFDFLTDFQSIWLQINFQIDFQFPGWRFIPPMMSVGPSERSCLGWGIFLGHVITAIETPLFILITRSDICQNATDDAGIVRMGTLTTETIGTCQCTCQPFSRDIINLPGRIPDSHLFVCFLMGPELFQF